MSEWYTLKEMIELVDIPENSLKRYIQEHDNFIKFNKEHNRYKIHESATTVLKKIRKLYGEGHKKDEVNDRLREMGTPMDIVVESEAGERDLEKKFSDMEAKITRLVEAQERQDIVNDNLMEFNNNLKEFNKSLMNEVLSLKSIANKKESEEIASLRLSLDKKRETEEKQALIEATTELVKDAIATNKEELMNQVKDATNKLVNIADEKNEEELKKIVIDTLKEQQEVSTTLATPDTPTPKKKSIFSWFSK